MIRSIRKLSVVAALSLAVLGGRAARADDGALLRLDAGASKLQYKIVHKLHESVGVSKKAEGAAKILPDGTVQVSVRAPVASFDSGNSGRDEHMQETMEATKYPMVAFKGLGKVAIPSSFPATVNVNVQGKLDFHGRQKDESFPVTVTFNSPTEAHVTSKFNVSLDKYEVERPSLLLMKIDDACQVELDLLLKKQ